MPFKLVKLLTLKVINLLKTNEDTAPQTSEFSQLGSYIFARVGSITFKLGNFTNVKRSFH